MNGLHLFFIFFLSHRPLSATTLVADFQTHQGYLGRSYSMEVQPTNAQLGITITASCMSTGALVHQIIQGVGRRQGTSPASIWRRNLSAVSCCAEWTLAVLCAVAMFHKGSWSPPRPKSQFLLRTDEPIARDLVFRLSTTAVAFTEVLIMIEPWTTSY